MNQSAKADCRRTLRPDQAHKPSGRLRFEGMKLSDQRHPLTTKLTSLPFRLETTKDLTISLPAVAARIFSSL